MSSEILSGVYRVLEVGITVYGAIWFKDYLAKRGRIKKVDDISSDFARKNKILPILEDTRFEVGAERVFEWVFSNGDTTLSGHHLKKMSIFVESCSEGIFEVGHNFQFVPTKKFERDLHLLCETDFSFSDERHRKDELSALYRQQGVSGILNIKIKNSLGRWVGILSICYPPGKYPTEEEIAFCKLQAARIGQIK